MVEVEILRGASTRITSGQISVTFYQLQPVTEKVQSRVLKAGFYTKEDILISDTHELHFTSTSENPREREQTVRFLFIKTADKSNNQDVILKLEEPIQKTSKYTTYNTLTYPMRRPFGTDFDF